MLTSTDKVALSQIVILVLCVIVFNVVLFVAWDLFRKRHILKFSKKIKGFNFYPIIGNGYHVIGENILSGVQKVIRRYKLPCNIWVGHDYSYITADAAEIKVILNHPNTFNKSTMYENFSILFIDSLLLAPFETWKINRKIYAKSFSQPILNSFVETFYKKSCTLVTILKESRTRDKFDIFERLSLDNFCANVMQLDLDAQVNINDELTEITRRLQDLAGRRMFTSFIYPNFIWYRCPEGSGMLKDVDKLRKLIFEMIQKKRAAFKEGKEFREDGEKLPMMDMMLEAEGTTFSDEEIFREIVLFLLAATDTSGITLAFTFTLLGMNLEAQDKVYQEVKHHVGIHGPIYHDDLSKLKYTERAIHESMRLLPAAPLIGRRVTANIDLGSREVPTGSNVLISIFNLHRSESYWENPLEYNPDRFLPELVAKRDPYCFIPFAAGPRNCIGKAYAMMMMKTTVVEVIRNFEIRSQYKSVEELELSSCVTMKTNHDLNCQFIPRMH